MTTWKQRVPGAAYLALPYTGRYGPNCPRYRREFSFQVANAVAARLMEDGEVIFSPISHSHCIGDFMVNHKKDHDFWNSQNTQMMSFCNRIYVIKLDGWQHSRGVKFEINWFIENNLPVFWLHFDQETGGIIKTPRNDFQHEEVRRINGTKVKFIQQLNIFAPLDKMN